MEFDYDLENFFPIGDSGLEYYHEFSDKFGHDNDYILIGIKDSKGVFNVSFLEEIDRLTGKLSALKGTSRVMSITNLKKMVKSPMGLLEFPLLHINNQKKLNKDSIDFELEISSRESFLSKDGKSIKIIVQHHRFTDKNNADEYVYQLKKVFEGNDFEFVLMAGMAVAQQSYVTAVEEDFSKFLIGALVLIFIFLILFMRNLPIIITSLLIAGLAVGSTIGIMILAGKKLDILSALIPSILLVVSMSNTVHLFTHINKERARGKSLHEAINHSVKVIGIATFLTSFTTAVGFLTLMTISVVPIIDLGIYAAVGISVAFIITYLLFPQMITLLKPKVIVGKENERLQRVLRKAFLLVLKKQKAILGCSAGILIIVGVGISLLEINAYLVDDLPKDDPVKDAFLYFDTEYAGSNPFSISLWPTNDSIQIYSKEVITEIYKMEQLARIHVLAGDLISPATYVMSANQTLHSGIPKYYSLPTTDSEWKKVFRFLKKYKPEKKFIKVTTNKEAQISGFFRDFGTKDTLAKNKKLSEALAKEIDTDIVKHKLTGTTLLIAKSHGLLSMNLIKGLFLAMLLVGAIAGVLFKSWQMILITILPNLFPLLVTAAIMGFAGIPIYLNTSIIFAISFGIVVDDTIHFLSKLRMEYHGGKSLLYSLKRTIFSTGEPIIITTVILIGGFLVFCFSQFNATFYTGLFIAISFIVAVIADLILLPVLILLFMPSKK